MSEKKQSVAQTVKETVSNRIKELRAQIGPLVKEEAELVEMVPTENVRFGAHEQPKPQAAPTPAKPEEPTAPKATRSRKGGTRADQAVEFIAANPGARASEVAEALKIKPNYLYRVLSDLEEKGRVSKDGKKYTVSA